MKITKYITAYGSSAKELDEQVNELIDQGFAPFGNPYLTDNPVEGKVDTFGMFQAMVMDKDTEAKLLAAKAEIAARRR